MTNPILPRRSAGSRAEADCHSSMTPLAGAPCADDGYSRWRPPDSPALLEPSVELQRAGLRLQARLV